MKIFTLTLNVVLLHELLHIDKIGGKLAHGCRKVRVVLVNESLARQVSDVVSTEATILHVTVLIHHLHVLLDVVSETTQCRHVWLKINGV